MANVYIKTVNGGEKATPALTDAIELDDGSTSQWTLLSAIRAVFLASPTLTGTVVLPNNTVTLAMLATQAANTILAEATGSTAVPTAVALAANKFLARSSAGNIAAKDITDFALTILDDANAATMLATLGAAPTASPTFTGTVILPKAIEIQDTSADHQYVLAVSELTADRTVTLPLLAGNDVFVFSAFAQTLTNKRITRRVASTTDDATAVIDCDAYDDYYLTAVANATEISVTGTPTDGQTIFIGLKDAGVTKNLTWTGITGLGQTLPAATTAGKQHIIGIKYIAAAWYAIAVSVAA
jgi:hypothetical protein